MFSLLLAMFPFFAGAQQVKLYGYRQKVVPGITAARELNENGTSHNVAAETLQDYFLYLSAPAKSGVYVVEGRLDGQRVGLISKAVSSPVVLPPSLPTGESVEAVPKLPGIVLQITTTTASTATKASARAETLAVANEMVVVYKLNGKVGYATLWKLKELPASHWQ